MHRPALEALRSRLREHVAKNKLKTSTRRELILDTLADVKRHVTADELLREVRERDPRIGAATVYRTLRVFQESGIVAERRFEGGATRFELVSDEHHDHLICMRCRKIFEFENEAIEEQQRKVAENLGFQLKDHKLELYGWCQRTNCPNLT